MRAHVILLSHRKYKVKDIANIYDITRQTVSSCLKSWENNGIVSLLDLPRTGSPTKIKDFTMVTFLIEKFPQSIKKVISQLKVQGISVSPFTIKRYAKRNNWSWRRVRTSLKSKRDAQHNYHRRKDTILKYVQKEKSKEVELYYFDESGFSLTPCIPYAWQKKMSPIEIPSSRSKRLNILGFMNKHDHLYSFLLEGSVTSEVVAQCFDNFSQQITKKTVVILDNSSLHHSRAFKNKLKQWYKKGLILKFLPKYSPELNLIEILWRKMKYEWLSFQAYDSFRTLKEEVENIVKYYGTSYSINFT